MPLTVTHERGDKWDSHKCPGCAFKLWRDGVTFFYLWTVVTWPHAIPALDQTGKIKYTSISGKSSVTYKPSSIRMFSGFRSAWMTFSLCNKMTIICKG